MTSKCNDRSRMRARSKIAAATAVAALALVATTTSTIAGTAPPGTDESTTTTPAATTTSEATTQSTDDATSTSSADATTTAPSTTTAAPTGFAAVLAEQCEGDTGHQLLASGLQVVMGDDGSLRIVEILLACDIEFAGAVDPDLGRPTTNVEAIIADPANNVTANQAQLDLLNEELANYWRIADAWAQSQTAAEAPTEPSAPASDVPTSAPEESVTTGG